MAYETIHEETTDFDGVTCYIKRGVIVRCKDCAHCIQEKLLCTHPRNRVFNTGINVSPDHYCSYGERRCG